MKTLIIVALVMLGSPVWAQVKIDTTTYRYCEVVGAGSSDGARYSPLLSISVDFGDGVSYGERFPLKDKDGNEVKIKSMAHMLSFLALDHWELVSSCIVVYDGKVSLRNYMKRPKYLK